MVKVIEPDYLIEDCLDGQGVLETIAHYGRAVYKYRVDSLDKTAEEYVREAMAKNYLPLLEHISITVRILTDQIGAQEWAKYKNAVCTQEITERDNYSSEPDGRNCCVVRPCSFEEGSTQYHIWYKAMQYAQEAYTALIEESATPAAARAVLPASLKTQVLVTMNLREWRQFFQKETDKDSCVSPQQMMIYRQMQQIVVPLLREFQSRIPVVFEDVLPEKKSRV